MYHYKNFISPYFTNICLKNEHDKKTTTTARNASRGLGRAAASGRSSSLTMKIFLEKLVWDDGTRELSKDGTREIEERITIILNPGKSCRIKVHSRCMSDFESLCSMMFASSYESMDGNDREAAETLLSNAKSEEKKKTTLRSEYLSTRYQM